MLVGAERTVAMPSRSVLAALAALVTVLVVGAGVALAATGGTPTETDGRTISVVGSGEIDAQPDAAEVSLSVTARGADAASVSDDLAAGAQQLRATLAEFGVPDDAVQTRGYSVREDPRTREERNQTTYVGEQTFTVTLDDVDQVGGLIDAAVAGGADDVGGVHYTLSEDRRDAIREQALGVAIDEARSEAAVVANETGLSIGTVRSASTQDTGFEPYRADVSATAMEADDAGTQLDPQDVTVSATVQVTFDAAV